MSTRLLSLAIPGSSLLALWWLSGLAAFVEAPTYAQLSLVAMIAALAGILGHKILGDPGDRRMASETDLASILDHVPGLIAIADAGGNLSYINRWNRDRPGMDVSTVARHGWLEMVHPDERDRMAAEWRRCLQSGQPMDVVHRLRRRDGAYRWFHARIEPARDGNGRVERWYGLIADIDDQKRAEQALAAKEAELKQLVDAIPTLVWSTAADGSAIFLNRRWLEYTGLSREQAIGWGWTTTIHPDDRDRLVEYWESLLATGRPGETEARMRRSDGHYRWFLFRGEPVHDASGATIRWFGSNTDIDDLKRSEEALRARERELQLNVDAIPTLVWCVSPEGEPEYINRQMSLYLYGDVRSVDRSESDVGTRLDMALGRLMHPDDLPSIQRKLSHSLRTGEPFAMRYRNRRADGAYRWVDARAEPLRDDDGRIVKWYGVSVDIDDEVKAQESLRIVQQELSRASQLAGLAELSASIAHEVNQPLAAVVASSYACQHWLSADPPNLQRVKTITERIVRDANAAADVLTRVRALFKQARTTRAWIDVNAAVGEVSQLVMDEMTANDILLTTDLDPALPSVFADRVQIQQVLVNLIRNGIDALGSNAGLPKSLLVASRRDSQGSVVVVEVRDNGEGIAEPERIFEPLFTTKADGMGMGLSICRSIVETHGGSLRAQNLLPRGAAFSFTLPIGAAADTACSRESITA